MTKHTHFWLLFAALSLVAPSLGCGPSAALQAALASLPGELQAGGRIVLYAPPNTSCATTFAMQQEALATGGTPLQNNPNAQTPLLVNVIESTVEGSDVLLTVSEAPAGSPQQALMYLRVPSGKHARCLWTDPAPFQAALARIGEQVAFTPWKPSCGQIHAVGEGAASVLVEADPVLTFEISAVELGAESAAEFSPGAGGGTVWYELGSGALRVRGDTLASCFSDPSAGEVSPPSFAALLATPAERCATDPADGKHVTCHTSLGVWTGEADDGHVALRRLHRTLGPAHFHDGHPVSAAPYARTFVSIEQPSASSDHANHVLAALEAGKEAVVAKALDDSVRLVEPKADHVTHRLRLSVEAQVGPLRTRQVPQSSRYKKGEKTVTNPERAPAEQRLARAKDQLVQEEETYTRDKEQYEEAKQTAIDECHEQANNATDEEKLFLNMSCDVGGLAIGFINPSTDAVDAARQELRDAERHLANTPPTIQEDIMDTWSYDKTVYSRSSDATVRIELQSLVGATPIVATIPVSHDWEDHEVQDDDYHNVEGHLPDRGPIERPESMLDPLATKLKPRVTSQLQAMIVRASLEAATKAFREAGKAEPKAGFELVDAVAYQVGGERIKRMALRGKSAARGDSPLVLPTGNASFAADECLLAVAAVPLEESGWTELTMATRTGTHLDGRARPLASFEVCGYEVTGTPKIEVASSADTQVLWGLYITDGGSAQGLVGPATKEAAGAPGVAAPVSTAAAPTEVVAAAPTATAAAPAAGPAPVAAPKSGAAGTCRNNSDCRGGTWCKASRCVGPGGVEAAPRPVAPAAASPPARQPPARTPPAVVDESRLGSEGESCRARSDCKSGLRCINKTCTR